MSAWQERVSELQREAALFRKRGDALRRTGQEAKASSEYRAGVDLLDQAAEALNTEWNRLEQPSSGAGAQADRAALARELIEVWGARGGMLRRLGEAQAALDSYVKGGDIERDFVPRSTYNRVNAVKYGLLTGLRSLSQLEHQLQGLERLLTEQLAADQELSDSGWAWADLGDCRALLGDVEGAERAYRAFVEKAESKAPRATLEVLESILGKLDETGDPRADSVRTSLRKLKERLA